MEKRALGTTGLTISAIGFGCGSVGGLMTRGTAAEQERAVARAIELGVDYFDTAAQYGDGKSEEALGRALRAVKPRVVHVATKVKVPDKAEGGIGAAIEASLEASLARLGRDHVDLLQLHNTIDTAPRKGALTPDQVLAEAVPALERLQAAGKIRFFGMTGLGDTAALHRVIDAGHFASVQVAFNLLNPSPMAPLPAGYPAQDYRLLLDRARAAGMAGIGIRIMAGGALGGPSPHPLARGDVDPMGTGSTIAADRARAARFDALVDQGHVADVPEAAIRYAMGGTAMATVLIGVSGIEQIEHAVAAAAKGPLPPEALRTIADIQAGFAGEPR